MEHILHNTIITSLEDLNILSDYRHGFQKKRSCEVNWSLLYRSCQTALTQVTKSTASCSTSQGHSTRSHTSDFSTSATTTRSGETLQWIASFLQQCTQEVIREEVKSRRSPVTSGVPQGTSGRSYSSYALMTCLNQ
jgi:hypothetical protein